jgi:membrane-bound lytic murein transglycosylase B
MGIIGVETFYGQIMGSFRVLDVLATLAFDFPRGRSDRSPFFRDELAAFLLLASTEQQPATAFKGSFAGAMGLGQFMPSSWRRWAVDFDGDRHIDLIDDADDAIGSVAHYLQAHGWTRGQPTHLAVEPPQDAAERARLLAPDIDPRWGAADLHALALSDTQRLLVDQHAPWALVLLENGDTAPPTHVLATRNFWVVTRYNRSSYYALAVIELGERLAALRLAGQVS